MTREILLTKTYDGCIVLRRSFDSEALNRLSTSLRPSQWSILQICPTTFGRDDAALHSSWVG